MFVLLGPVGFRRLWNSSGGPAGTLVFVDKTDDDVVGQVRLSGRRGTIQWSLGQCTERLPAVGLQLLRAERGPIIEQKTTALLTLIGPDGKAVMRLFHDHDVAFLTDALDRRVIYYGVMPAPKYLEARIGQETLGPAQPTVSK